MIVGATVNVKVNVTVGVKVSVTESVTERECDCKCDSKCDSKFDSKYESRRDRNDIERQLIDLSSGLDQILSDVRKLKSQLTDQDTKLTHSIVDIINLRRSRVKDGLNFSVTYRPAVDDVSVIWTDQVSNLTVHNMEIDKDTRLSSVLYPPVDYGVPLTVNFYSLKLLQNIAIHTSPSGDDVTQSAITAPYLVTTPSGDIIYEAGRNVSVKFQIKSVPDGDEILSRIWSETVNLNSLKFRTDYHGLYGSSFIELSKSGNPGKARELNVNLMTSKHFVSGLLYVNIDQFRNGNLVTKMTFSMMKRLRPSSVTDPFPRTFLHIKDRRHSQRQDGVNHVTIQPGGSTRLYCEAVGLNVTHIYWTKHSGDGTVTDIRPDPTSHRRLAHSPYYYDNGITVTTTENDLSDRGDIYTCTAENAFNARAVKTFKLVPETPLQNFTLTELKFSETGNVSIDKNSAGINTRKSDSDKSSKSVHSSDSSIYSANDRFNASERFNASDDVNASDSSIYSANDRVNASDSVNANDSPNASSYTSSSSVIEFINASRAAVVNGSIYTVTYRQLVDDVKVTWSNGTTNLPGSFTHHLTDVRTARVVYHYQNVLFPYLEATFESLQRRSAVVVVVFDVLTKENLNATKHDTNIPLMEVQYEGGEGMVYLPGHDVRFKLKVSEVSDVNRVEVDILTDFLDLKSGQFRSIIIKPNESNHSFMDITERKVECQMYEYDVSLLTSASPMCGLMLISVRRTMATGPLRFIQISQHKLLKPSNQIDLFPERFLTVKVVGGSSSSVEGSTQINCRADEMCRLTCVGMGINIVGVVLEMFGDGDKKIRLEESHFTSIKRNNYSFEVSHTFWVGLTDNKSRSFECTAENTHGDVSSKKVIAVADTMLDIVQQESRVVFTLAWGKSRPGYNITCTIRSSRKPQVSLTFTTAVSRRNNTVPAYRVKRVSGMEYRVQQFKTFDPNKPGTVLESVTCTARIDRHTASRVLVVAAALRLGAASLVSLCADSVSISSALVATSPALVATYTAPFATPSALVPTSSTPVVTSPALVATSPALVSNSTALVATSPALVSNSTALVSNSTALISNSTALVSNSTALVATSPALVCNSTALVATSPALVSNSTALVATSTALVSNSTALVATSTALVSNSTALVSISLALIAIFPVLVGTFPALVATSSALVCNSTSIITTSPGATSPYLLDTILLQIQDIEKRLLELDNGLDKLIIDVSKLKSQLTGVTDQPVSSSIVDIVMVQRTRVANGFNFSVTYRPHIDDVSVWWTDYKNILKPDSVHTVDMGQNTKMTSVLYPVLYVERTKIIVVNFFSPKLLSYVDVQLHTSINDDYENITQSVDSTPSLAVGTTGDIVYEKGKNVSIKSKYYNSSFRNPCMRLIYLYGDIFSFLINDIPCSPYRKAWSGVYRLGDIFIAID
ncbi:hypothetical protein Btru_010901 [Bulinus truncatus]|nr:hypothetical protein Btru_010901 [Bulinus truncatus]